MWQDDWTTVDGTRSSNVVNDDDPEEESMSGEDMTTGRDGRTGATSAGRGAFPEPRTADRLHLRKILENQATGGLLMLAATIAALLWANLGSSSYQSISHHEIAGMSVAHWTADGLLTIFFFVAGMELKREFVEGALSRPADAMVPIVAAACGMAVPALIYVGVNLTMSGGHPHGWAVPVATDIAFALAVLSIVGRHLPLGLRAVLLTLAIVDDLGGILVIAVFFAHGFNAPWLAAVAALLALWWGLQKAGVGNGWLFIPIGVATWYCMLQSGIHATIAGVALGLLVRTVESEMSDNLDRWMHNVEPWSAGLIVPLFALFAAGVPVSGDAVGKLWTNPVPLGIIGGLVLGKTVGVFLGAWLTTRFSRATLPDGVTWGDILGMAMIAGIGFTVAILIADLSFPGMAEVTEQAKTAVLMASLTAAVLGGIMLAFQGRRHQRHHERYGRPSSVPSAEA